MKQEIDDDKSKLKSKNIFIVTTAIVYNQFAWYTEKKMKQKEMEKIKNWGYICI